MVQREGAKTEQKLEKEKGKRERTAERRSEGSEAQEAREGTIIEYPPRFNARAVHAAF